MFLCLSPIWAFLPQMTRKRQENPFLKVSLWKCLCQANLESESSYPGHEIAHTHTHTHTHSIQYYWVPCRWLISHQEKNPPEGRDLPLYPSIKVNTLHQPPFCTWTLFSPSSPLDFFRPAFTKQAGCLPHWPRHSLWEVAARSLWAGDTFPPGVTPPSSGLYSHRTPAGRAWSLPPAPQYIGC